MNSQMLLRGELSATCTPPAEAEQYSARQHATDRGDRLLLRAGGRKEESTDAAGGDRLLQRAAFSAWLYPGR